MIGLLKTICAQTGIYCKTGPWQMQLAIRQSRDVWALRAGNIACAFITVNQRRTLIPPDFVHKLSKYMEKEYSVTVSASNVDPSKTGIGFL